MKQAEGEAAALAQTMTGWVKQHNEHPIAVLGSTLLIQKGSQN